MVKEKVEMPRIIGMNIQEAKQTLKEYDLNLQIDTEIDEIDEENMTITEQLPINGITLYKGSNVLVKIE